MCFFKKKAKKVAEPKKEEKKVEAPKQEAKKEAAPKVEAKKAAPAKKTQPKVEAKKAEPKVEPKKEEAPVAEAKEEPKKEAKRVYHVAKREDGMWQVKFAGGQKAIKLFKTKVEAEAYTKQMAENQDGVMLSHNSKGANKGRIGKK